MNEQEYHNEMAKLHTQIAELEAKLELQTQKKEYGTLTLKVSPHNPIVFANYKDGRGYELDFEMSEFSHHKDRCKAIMAVMDWAKNQLQLFWDNPDPRLPELISKARAEGNGGVYDNE